MVVVVVVVARDDQSQPAGMSHVRWDGFSHVHQSLNNEMALENQRSNFFVFFYLMFLLIYSYYYFSSCDDDWMV